jgi:transposase-like protein
MGKPNFSVELKRDALAQIAERGCPLAEVSHRLGKSLSLVHAVSRIVQSSFDVIAPGSRQPALQSKSLRPEARAKITKILPQEAGD